MTPGAERRAAAFIRDNLPLRDVPGTGVRLHLAAPTSGLARLVRPGGTPYWAHAWPGGVTLAMVLASGSARGRMVVEIGGGSGLASIAALRAGAGGATCFDADPLATVAARLNADANGVALVARTARPERLAFDLSSIRTPGRPLIVAGDVFYDAHTAAFMADLFGRLAPIADILVGDIGRPHLPRDRLEPLAAYPVRDVGDPPDAPAREGWAFRWRHP